MSVQRPNITRSEGLTDYGRSAKKRFIDPQSPRVSDALADPAIPAGSSNILYLVLAAAGISSQATVALAGTPVSTGYSVSISLTTGMENTLLQPFLSVTVTV